MTERSQARTHAGKRGAAQRKARREGYAFAPVSRFAAAVACIGGWNGKTRRSKKPRLVAEFRHGVHDYRRKHGDPQDLVEF